MHVPAPSVEGCGEKTSSSPNKCGQKVYNTFSEAFSNLNIATHTYTAIDGKRQKFLCGSGKTLSGFIATDYSSLAVTYDYGRLRFVTHNFHPRFPSFVACNFAPGVGYLGGFNTGLGEPISSYNWLAHRNSTTAIINALCVNNLKRRLEVECLLKARQQQMDLGETLVGLNQTKEMLIWAMKKLILAYVSARKGRWQEAKRQLGITKHTFSSKGGSAKWLELQYGWLPLLMDIYAAAKLLQNGLDQKKGLVTVTRRGRAGLQTERHMARNAWNSNVEGYANVQGEVKYLFDFPVERANFLKTFGLENPAYIAWVAMPWSFVIDWLIPIADMLQAFSAPAGLVFRSGYTSIKVEVNTTELGDPIPEPGYVIASPDGKFSFKMRAVILRRYAHNTWPWPQVYIRFPIRSLRRLISALALARSLNR